MNREKGIEVLARKVELKTKELGVQVGKIEQIYNERKIKVEVKYEELRKIESAIQVELERRKKKLLSGVLEGESSKVGNLVSTAEKIRDSIKNMEVERDKAWARLTAARVELEGSLKERDGLVKIKDDRVLDRVRVKIENSELD